MSCSPNVREFSTFTSSGSGSPVLVDGREDILHVASQAAVVIGSLSWRDAWTFSMD
jgi:hypothetical protein